MAEMMYDLIVIGGGPAGYLGAERAAHAGLKTLLLEKNSDRSVVMGVRSSVERALINDGFKDVHVTVSNADGAEPRIYIRCRW